MRNWITLIAATRLLGVRPQTVYAYASRGRIAVMPDPGEPGKSLYRARDVSDLRKRKATGRRRETLAAGTSFGEEPCIYTDITTFSNGHPYYRGMKAVRLSATATLEQVGAILWGTEQSISFESSELPLSGVPIGRACAYASLADLVARGHSTIGRADTALHVEAGGLVGIVALSFGAKGEPRSAPLHERMALGWGCGPAEAELIRRAMILAADHEMTSSAFSSRVTASTGASLAACLLTRLATFSGPLHGDASGRVRALFDEVQRLGAEQVVAHHLRSAIPIPGFGHHLYPDGDPRAAALMEYLSPPGEIALLIDRVGSLTGLKPNIDVALATLSAQCELPGDAAFGLFATARSVGLLAHSIGMVIRPRGRYTGPTLEDAKEAVRAVDAGRPDAATLEKNRIFNP